MTFFHCKPQHGFDQSPALKCVRTTGSEEFTQRPSIGRAEGSHVCCTICSVTLTFRLNEQFRVIKVEKHPHDNTSTIGPWLDFIGALKYIVPSVIWNID